MNKSFILFFLFILFLIPKYNFSNEIDFFICNIVLDSTENNCTLIKKYYLEIKIKNNTKDSIIVDLSELNSNLIPFDIYLKFMRNKIINSKNTQKVKLESSLIENYINNNKNFMFNTEINFKFPFIKNVNLKDKNNASFELFEIIFNAENLYKNQKLLCPTSLAKYIEPLDSNKLNFEPDYIYLIPNQEIYFYIDISFLLLIKAKLNFQFKFKSNKNNFKYIKNFKQYIGKIISNIFTVKNY